MFHKTKLCTSLLLAFGGSMVLTSLPVQAQTTERIEVTGSRIKRAEAEGALPVTVISREQLESSGAVTVAEFIRNSTFTSVGSFRPQSGSSAQAFAGVNLRGLGEARTLVLVDGRRVAKAPNVGDSVDMNSIPMAAVERIEILTDGASAIYGSDAIGGVVNVILRKDFEGLYLKAGMTSPSVKGGDREEYTAIMGFTSDKGRIIAGASKSSRDIIFVRDYPWGYTPGASTFSNTLNEAIDPVTPGAFIANAGTCDFPDKGFYTDGNGRCRYDFNLVAADEAATSSESLFTRGEIRLGTDWNAYMNASVTRNKSFGRYAPVPDNILITPGSVFDQQHLNRGEGGDAYFLRHRFAAAGNRDTSTDGNLYDIGLGVQGTVGNFDLDFGVRRTESKLIETGRGFVVKGLATAAINNGTYIVDDPFTNTDTVLKSITTTTGRESIFAQTELYASATTDLFKMGGGAAKLYLGAEARKEKYQDIYDSLSEAGEVLGSSGNSAAGGREVSAFTAEAVFPIFKELEASLAARYEHYSDYGSDFSPKASLAFRPMKELTLRAAAGKGFRAPSLPILTQKPAYSADTVVDLRNCQFENPDWTEEDCDGYEQQINGLRIANPELKSEKSTQFSVGAVWDITPALSIKADYWNTKIKDTISFISAQQIVDRDNGDSDLPIPGGLSIRRDPVTGAILQIVSGYANEGTLQFSGLDLDILFQHKYSGFGAFRHQFSYSPVFEAKVNSIETNGDFGVPKERATLANGWKIGDFDFTWNINYIGKNGSKADDNYTGAYITHDVQAAWNTPIKGSKVTIGAVNVTEKFPALVGSPYDQKPFNYYLYDAYGAQYYLRVEQKF